MAEFCFDCYKNYFDKNAKIKHLVMDRELDLCEGCGEYKPIVIKPHPLWGLLAPWLRNR